MHPPELKRRALRLYAEGNSLRDIAADLQLSVGTLWHWVRDAGIARDRSTSIQMAYQKRPVSELRPFGSGSQGSRGERIPFPQSAHPFTGAYPWSADSPEIRAFVDMAWRDEWLPSSIVSGRGCLKRYEAFVRRHHRMELNRAGTREFVSFKTHLLQSGKRKATLRCHLELIVAYYRLKAERSQNPEDLDRYARIWHFGRVYKPMSEHYKPFSPETLNTILTEANRGYRRGPVGHPMKEDYLLLMTLLYTGGRAQFYGLRVEELDFTRMEIRTTAKGGRPVVIPLHPRLASVLREHLRRRPYRSEFLFRFGMNPTSYPGLRANQQHAWAACKRAQAAAHLEESVHPQRFRLTLASLGRRLGLDPRVIQAILGHRRLGTTLDIYSRVQPDEARDAFAKIQLTRHLDGLGSEPSLDSTEAQMRLIPQDEGEAVKAVVQGLIGLMATTSLAPRTLHPPVRKARQLRPPERDR